METPRDLLRFLEPWTLLLPEGGGRVLAAVGSGGKSALLRRLHRHYRAEGQSVLWTQTVAHPAPEGLSYASSEASVEELATDLSRRGALFVAGELQADGRAGAVSPERIEELRRGLQPDVILVEAQSPCGTPLRRDGVAPVWPEPVHLVFPVVGLQAVGMLWGPRSIAGEEALSGTDGEPRRVLSEEALIQLSGEGGSLAQLPDGVPAIPFLAGFGSYRDMDGMFALVTELWEDERLRAVLLGELVGEARIDEAERIHAADSPTGASHLSGERIFALYPAHLDNEA